MNRSVWFPGDLAERVEQEATRQDRSFNWVVVKALESALSSTVGGVTASEPLAGAKAASSRAPLPPGVKSARELAMERQRKMNERKS